MCGGLQAILLSSCSLALCGGSFLRWCPLPRTNGIKLGIEFIYLE
jgi:hypothetical protein